MPAGQAWTDTEVDVSGSVMLTASGTINVGGPESNLPPAGSKSCVASASQYSGQWVALGFPCWSLIARVGNNPAFKVGNGGTFTVPSGRLLLGVDDELAAFGDNSGSWTVDVQQTQQEALPPQGPKQLADQITNLILPLLQSGGGPLTLQQGFGPGGILTCIAYVYAHVSTGRTDKHIFQVACSQVMEIGLKNHPEAAKLLESLLT
ncbi:MAG TPA: hypothetical protein VF317_07550 [Dermatophilaceae bacterium]